MRVTTKGQVTIPQEIREKFGLLPGTDVEFQVDGNTVRIVPSVRGSRGERLGEHLRGRATVSMSTDEIMALTREAP
ncbi:AbrB/MazE/SpoVT family DNA-binding domain-containing protein [bacterium]|nr:AbrB/MazE/SpoVT family DNA-binding domain-containing protein [bacterium]